jgi:hypothetical protein
MYTKASTKLINCSKRNGGKRKPSVSCSYLAGGLLHEKIRFIVKINLKKLKWC